MNTLIKFKKQFGKTASLFLGAVLLTSIFFLPSCEEKNKAAIPPPPTVSTTEKAKPLNETVKNAYESHKNKCPNNSQAGMEIYNKAYQIMEWIEEKRGLNYMEFPPICFANTKDFTKSFMSIIDTDTDAFSKYENTLKAIGLLKPQIDYRKTYEEMAKTEYMGYYDQFDKLLMVDKEKSMPISTLVHELVHVLQDQHYLFIPPLDQKDFTPSYYHPYQNRSLGIDEILARKSIVEGEADITKSLYNKEKEGKAILPNDNDMQELIENNFKNISPDDIPYMILQTNLLYGFGVLFVRHAMGGKYNPEEIDDLFNSPPTSSEQVFSPNKYDTEEKGEIFTEFITSKFDILFSPLSQVDLSIRSLGQIGLASLIRTYVTLDKPVEFAIGWDGDRTLVYSKTDENGNFKWQDAIFISLVKWDSDNDAGNFVLLINEMIINKYEDTTPEDYQDYQLYEFKVEGKPKFAIVAQDMDRTMLIERISEEMKDNFLESEINDFLSFLKEDYHL